MDLPGGPSTFHAIDLDGGSESDGMTGLRKRPRLNSTLSPARHDDPEDSADEFGYLDAILQGPVQSLSHSGIQDLETQEAPQSIGQVFDVDGEPVYVPNSPPFRPATTHSPLSSQRRGLSYTVDECIQQVVEIFPDIEREYVRRLYEENDNDFDYEVLSGPARFENIVEKLLGTMDWPKESKSKQMQRKRKHQASTGESTGENIDERIWDHPNRPPPRAQTRILAGILKLEFPEIPVEFIIRHVRPGAHLYQAYLALAKTKEQHDAGTTQYGRGRRESRNRPSGEEIATSAGRQDLIPELQAARQHVKAAREEAAAEAARKQAEAESFERARLAGEIVECQACFDELPMSRQMHCIGDTAHFICFECAERYIQAEVGQARGRLLCVAGCGAEYSYAQLNLLANKDLLDKLAKIQQEKDIRDAGLVGLEECPFCDYKAIAPPIEQDFEFRCANPDCEKVSCRRCRSISHIPSSCADFAKSQRLDNRHRIEEAMTAAMIRSCNKCKSHFIRVDGCNKMTCPSCGNVQCYVCSEDTRDYKHFDERAPGNPPWQRDKMRGCPLYDDVEERHLREVTEAEAVARAEVLEENPGMNMQDLDVKIPKSATSDPAQKAVPAGNGIYRGVRDPRDILGAANHVTEEQVRQLRAATQRRLQEESHQRIHRLMFEEVRREQATGSESLHRGPLAMQASSRINTTDHMLGGLQGQVAQHQESWPAQAQTHLPREQLQHLGCWPPSAPGPMYDTLKPAELGINPAAIQTPLRNNIGFPKPAPVIAPGLLPRPRTFPYAEHDLAAEMEMPDSGVWDYVPRTDPQYHDETNFGLNFFDMTTQPHTAPALPLPHLNEMLERDSFPFNFVDPSLDDLAWLERQSRHTAGPAQRHREAHHAGGDRSGNGSTGKRPVR